MLRPIKTISIGSIVDAQVSAWWIMMDYEPVLCGVPYDCFTRKSCALGQMRKRGCALRLGVRGCQVFVHVRPLQFWGRSRLSNPNKSYRTYCVSTCCLEDASGKLDRSLNLGYINFLRGNPCHITCSCLAKVACEAEKTTPNTGPLELKARDFDPLMLREMMGKNPHCKAY